MSTRSVSFLITRDVECADDQEYDQQAHALESYLNDHLGDEWMVEHPDAAEEGVRVEQEALARVREIASSPYTRAVKALDAATLAVCRTAGEAFAGSTRDVVAYDPEAGPDLCAALDDWRVASEALLDAIQKGGGAL